MSPTHIENLKEFASKITSSRFSSTMYERDEEYAFYSSWHDQVLAYLKVTEPDNICEIFRHTHQEPFNAKSILLGLIAKHDKSDNKNDIEAIVNKALADNEKTLTIKESSIWAAICLIAGMIFTLGLIPSPKYSAIYQLTVVLLGGIMGFAFRKNIFIALIISLVVFFSIGQVIK
jgi:hypothetical protein